MNVRSSSVSHLASSGLGTSKLARLNSILGEGAEGDESYKTGNMKKNTIATMAVRVPSRIKIHLHPE